MLDVRDAEDKHSASLVEWTAFNVALTHTKEGKLFTDHAKELRLHLLDREENHKVFRRYKID